MFAYAKPEKKKAFKNVVQKKDRDKSAMSPNLTGIPDGMKTQFENLSGFSFDDVRVHYNSDKPAQLQALAYTQGNRVYVAPGQEKHLGHELGHVVQQKLGIVYPTKVRNGVSINDDERLEDDKFNFSNLSEGFNKNESVIQKKSAIDIFDLLEMNGVRRSDMEQNHKVLYTRILKYSEMPEQDYDAQLQYLETELSGIGVPLHDVTKPGIGSDSFTFTLSMIRNILENEQKIVAQQKEIKGVRETFGMDSSKKTLNGNDLTTATSDQLKSVIPVITRRIEFLQKASEDTRARIDRMDAKNPSYSALRRKYDGINVDLQSFRGLMTVIGLKLEGKEVSPFQAIKFKNISKINLGTPSQIEDPYASLNKGDYWKNDAPKGSEKHVAEHLSRLNMDDITTQFDAVTKTDEEAEVESFLGMIETMLLMQTEFAHYSDDGNLTVLMSGDYGTASGTGLSSENSASSLDTRLGNKGFVFFFLEKLGEARESRFGSYRYSVPTKEASSRKILRNSWVMLSDLTKGFESFKGIETEEPDTDPSEWMKFFGDPELTGEDVTTDKKYIGMMAITSKADSAKISPIRYQKFSNYLAGNDIIPGLAKRALQILLLRYDTIANIMANEPDLIKTILRMYRIQVMCPNAVIPFQMKKM